MHFDVNPGRVSTRLLLLAALVSVLSLGAFGSTVAVGTCTNLPFYSTIQLAVNSVPAGSTIKVCPGTYPEQVMITKKLTLTGVVAGTMDAAVIVPPAGGLLQNGSDIFGNPVAAQIFVASTSGGVTISHLTVDGTGNDVASCGLTLEGIYFQNTPGTITNNVVRNQYQTDYADYGGCQNGLAINVESLTPNAVTVSFNSVRSYQKNGITATGAATGPGSSGPVVTISSNYIVGLGATARNWQGFYLNEINAAENGVQVGFGATGKVMANVVNDNIWGTDTSSDTGDAASGILIFASDAVMVSGNEVGSAQFGIVADTDTYNLCDGASCGPADNNIITSNKVAGTQLFDGIDLCGNSNTAHANSVYGSSESGVHIDSTCGTGNNNTVTNNTINEACAGILLGSGSGNTTTPDTFNNVTNTTLGGDVCPATMGDVAKAAGQSKRHLALRPSPYKSGK